MTSTISPPEFRICDVKLHAVLPEDARAIVSRWAQSDRKFHYITSTNANNVALALESARYFRVMEEADLSLVDGVPFLWYGRFKGYDLGTRCGIEELMESIFEASNQGVTWSHFFYGNTPEVLESLRRELLRRYPNLKIAGMLSPPFRPLTPAEDEEHIRAINASGADFLWVSLGCPKQEQWLFDHRDRLRVVAGGGAGAVFNMLAGQTSKAPPWVRKAGLEWVMRVLKEPKRLGYRYLVRYPRFMAQFVLHSLGLTVAKHDLASRGASGPRADAGPTTGLRTR